MKDNTYWEGKYQFLVKNAKTKEVIKEDVIYNRILDQALREMAKSLYDGNSDCVVNYLALGTNTATVNNTVTTLGSETFRTYKVVSASTVTGGEVRNVFNVLSTEAKFHIKEVGIFMGSTASATIGTGQLMSIINWDYDKTDKDVEIQINRYDSINRSTKERESGTYIPATPVESTTKDINFLVPCYIYPSAGSAWETLATLAASYGSRIQAIVNPDSGSGTDYDDNYYNATNDLKNAGGKVYGYVYTSYATRSTATIVTEITNYYNWYPIDGFFIDEMGDNSAYYKWIYNYIKSLDSAYEVIGNAGTTVDETYMYDDGTVTDILCCFENSTDYTAFVNSTWTNNYNSNRFYSICHGCTTASVAQSYIDHAVGDGRSKYLYITDDVMPNPFDTLPTYLTQLLNYCNF